MEEAKKLTVKTPDQSRATTPIQLPDTTGSDILNVIRELTPDSLRVPKSSISPSPQLVKSGDDKSPLISISPPETTTKSDVPDLIILESTKTSPVLSQKLVNNAKSSVESLDKIIDNDTGRSRSSDSNSLDDDKILRDSFPGSPTSSDDKSLDSLNKKTLFSSGSFTPDSDTGDKRSDELVESKSVKFNFDNATDDAKTDGKMSTGILKKSEQKAEESVQKKSLTIVQQENVGQEEFVKEEVGEEREQIETDDVKEKSNLEETAVGEETMEQSVKRSKEVKK
jgi:hypothetical protein